MLSMTPSQIVKELDRYIIGQADAKRSVAVALRNRYRRSKLAPEQRDEITPKNIIMSGPTGVGKTEIARRISRIIGAPFVKVEATKYTEVGYVGRDVDSMVRELVEASIRLVRSEKTEYVVIENRREAIRYALNIAKKDDVVVLAGKGHENYQEINGIKHPFDEKIIVAEILEDMRCGRK